MSSISTITFRARYLADVLSPLIGTIGHHVKSGLLGFGSAMILARRQIFWILVERRQTERKTRSHSLVLLPCCRMNSAPWSRMNSGWILLTPAALFGLTHLRAVLIASVEKLPERLRLALGAHRGSHTIMVMYLVKALSALENLPLLMS